MSEFLRDCYDTVHYMGYVVKHKLGRLVEAEAIEANSSSQGSYLERLKENYIRSLEARKNGEGGGGLDLGFFKSKRFFEIMFLLGGASFISYAMRTLYFGKTIRAIEIPDGNMMTIIVRSNNLQKLKKQILVNQPPIYPGVELTLNDIKASAFIEPHFTEPLVSNKEVKMIQDGSYIVWTKGDFEIPRTAVALKSLIKDKDQFLKFSSQAEIDKYIKQISLFGPELSASMNKKLSSMNIIKSIDPTSTIQQIKKIIYFFKKEKEPVLKEDPDTIHLTSRERDHLIDLIIVRGPQQDEIIHIFRKNKDNLYQLKYQLKTYISNYSLKKPSQKQ